MNNESELIAKWMGFIDGGNYWASPGEPFLVDGNHRFYPSELLFESSWDWLMPVWYKFRGMRFEDEFVKTLHTNYCARIAHQIAWGDIGSAHKILCNAIKWYNSLTILQKQTP